MSSFSVATLQEKLSRLSASQESIETLSLWIIHHKAFAKTSVAVWVDSFTNADPDHRLVLLYLANDILQNGKRRGAEMFHDLFRGPLQQVIPLTCGQTIQSSVERMFRIWRDRKVYDKAFVKQLDELLSGQSSREEPRREVVTETTPPPELLPDFKLSLLEDAVLELRKFHGEMRVKEASVDSLPMEIWDASSLGMLKDKSEGKEFSGQFDEAWGTLKDYSDCLGIEVSERVNLSTMLASCLAHQARELARVQEDVKMYKTLMVQLSSCREKLSVRQKDLDRAQQTATSDPSCKEDLNEVGDMEIDSEEETMDTQLSTPAQPPVVLQPPLPAPHMIKTSAAQVFNPPSQVMSSAPQPPSSASQTDSSPQVINSAPRTINSTPRVINSNPQMLGSAPQMINTASHTLTSTPQMMNSAPQAISSTPQMINSATQVITPSTSQPAVVSFSQPYPPPVQGFRPLPLQPPHPQRFSRPPLPSGVQTLQHSMMQRMQVPPTGMSPRFPFVPRGGQPGMPSPLAGPPQPRGPLGPPNSGGPRGAQHHGLMQFSNMRLQSPRPPTQPNAFRPPVMAGSGLGGRVNAMREEAHIESKPVLYRTEPEPEPKPSLDDRLHSLVVKKSLGSVLLQEYAESESESGEKPYSPTTEPLPPSGSPGDDDESVTTPTPQLDMSPVTPEDLGPPQFNPANPIMKALYHSPTHSPEEVDLESSGSTTEQPDQSASGSNGSVLSGVDTGMLQNILKNVQDMIPPKTECPTLSPTSSVPPPESSPPPFSGPPKQASTTPPLVNTTASQEKAAAKPSPAASNIKITSSLTNLLDEIFPQLSKSLQERKRKQEPGVEGTPANMPKQVKVGGALMPPRMMGPNSMMRPPCPLQPNGPHPNGFFSQRGPPAMIMRPIGPGGVRPPGMVLRPQGQRPSLEGGCRPRGPPFEGNFSPRGPPRPEGNIRPQGPPIPGGQPVGERLQCPPGQRPPFGPRNPISGPPPRQPFIPHSSYRPRMPPVSGQNFIRPPYGQRVMQGPPIPPLSGSGMELNHFANNVQPPQSHDHLQPIPPPGMGMWPGRP